MLTLDQVIEIVHEGSLTQRDTILLLLAIDAVTPKSPTALKGLGKKSGVKGISGWNIPSILAGSKGQAVPDEDGWKLSGPGKTRVTELAQAAGVSSGVTTPSAAPSAGKTAKTNPDAGRVFIGHGRSPAWKDLKDFVEKKLELPHDEFNRVATAGMTNIERLEHMMREAVFAFVVLTAEDEQKDGKLRARQNVVHECGLFQGRLGFKRAIILLEAGCEDFSNVDGLTHIPFPKGKILAASEDIRDVLIREGVLLKK